MSRSRLEMIYIDSEDAARKTNVGAVMETNQETWHAFLSAKQLEVPAEKAQFLLDYYNRKGDLADTICLDAAGFKQITGEPVLSEAEYVAIDGAYWKEAFAAASAPEQQTGA